MTDVLFMDAVGQAELVRRREITPRELVAAAVERIELLNPSVNAVVTTLFEQALDSADLETLPHRPFHGVPLLVKDYLCETAGDPYYEGMGLLRQVDWRSQNDSLLAQRFRAAGFVILGRTNVPELAASPRTEPLAFGATRNPWDLARSAGGSSGGSAAAVASAMVPVAHANDGTGSIRIPASCCGLVGLKPSRGRVPLGPGRTAGLLGNVAEFVLTRSVRDAAAVLDAIATPAPGELFVAPAPRRPYSAEIDSDGEHLRVGLLLHDPLLAGLRRLGREVLDTHAECIRAVQETARLLEMMGHTVEESYPAALDGPTGLGPARGIIASSGVAAALDTWSARLRRPIAAADVEPATWVIAEEGRRYTAAQVHTAYERLVTGLRPVHDWCDSGFDLLVTPTMNQLPPPIEASDGTDPHQQMWRNTEIFGLFTVPYSFTGQPAITLPVHWSGDLPVGVQLIAAFGREDVLIRVAAQLERTAPWGWRRPAGVWPQP